MKQGQYTPCIDPLVCVVCEAYPIRHSMTNKKRITPCVLLLWVVCVMWDINGGP